MENLLPQFLKIYPAWLICCLGGQKYVADRQIGALGLLRRYHGVAAGWYHRASRGQIGESTTGKYGGRYSMVWYGFGR